MSTSIKSVVIFNVMAIYLVKLERSHPNAEKSKQELKYRDFVVNTP